MTKEQLIELIKKTIPDGDLVTLRHGSRYFNVGWIEDSTDIGLWEIRLDEVEENKAPFTSAIEDTFKWKNHRGLTSEVLWKQ